MARDGQPAGFGRGKIVLRADQPGEPLRRGPEEVEGAVPRSPRDSLIGGAARERFDFGGQGERLREDGELEAVPVHAVGGAAEADQSKPLAGDLDGRRRDIDLQRLAPGAAGACNRADLRLSVTQLGFRNAAKLSADGAVGSRSAPAAGLESIGAFEDLAGPKPQ